MPAVIPRSFLLALAALGLVLTATVVPGVFTIDEDNYLVTAVALRHGRLTLPGTEDLPASRELLWFDPQGRSRARVTTPVTATAPPLWAPIALPFSYLGWRGLVALNTFAFLVTTWMVFALARRRAPDPAGPAADATGWLAAAVFVGGAYSLEYAQGVWPHSLTVALATGAVAAAGLCWDENAGRRRAGRLAMAAFAAGALAGLAAGIRYQNVLVGAGIGLAIFLWAPHRWRTSAAFAGGLALPLAASSLANHLRLGSWNPISKGTGYLDLGKAAAGANPVVDALRILLSRLVDYSWRPPLAASSNPWLTVDPTSGAYLVEGVVKKAWLQSAPWLALPLVLFAVAWLAGRRMPPGRERDLRAFSLVVAVVMIGLAAAGSRRTDGLCYNQRYYLDLMPLAAVAFAWGAEPLLRRRRALFAGICGAVLVVLALLFLPLPPGLVHLAVLDVPLVLALLLSLGWAVSRRPAGSGMGATGALAAVAAGLCLGWSLALHLGDDLHASRGRRAQSAAQVALIEPHLPDGAAVFVWWGNKDSLGPLLLDRDLVVADPWMDGGETAGELTATWLAAGRRVLVVGGMPPTILGALADGHAVSRREEVPVLEILGTRGPPLR